jgi:Enoyl-(Acyl carrier protein) reductase
VDDYHDAVVEPIPLPRVGQPDEIAAVVAFVATDDASSISGHTVYVNCGVHQLAARPIPILRTTVPSTPFLVTDPASHPSLVHPEPNDGLFPE